MGVADGVDGMELLMLVGVVSPSCCDVKAANATGTVNN